MGIDTEKNVAEFTELLKQATPTQLEKIFNRLCALAEFPPAQHQSIHSDD